MQAKDFHQWAFPHCRQAAGMSLASGLYRRMRRTHCCLALLIPRK